MALLTNESKTCSRRRPRSFSIPTLCNTTSQKIPRALLKTNMPVHIRRDCSSGQGKSKSLCPCLVPFVPDRVSVLVIPTEITMLLRTCSGRDSSGRGKDNDVPYRFPHCSDDVISYQLLTLSKMTALLGGACMLPVPSIDSTELSRALPSSTCPHHFHQPVTIGLFHMVTCIQHLCLIFVQQCYTCSRSCYDCR